MFFNQTEKKDHQATGITVPHHSGLLTNKYSLKLHQYYLRCSVHLVPKNWENVVGFLEFLHIYIKSPQLKLLKSAKSENKVVFDLGHDGFKEYAILLKI